MGAIKIDKGVKIPKLPNVSMYPFSEMEVGDSFMVPEGHIYTTVRVHAANYSKGKQCKFSVLKVENGHRCWRIK